MPTRSSRSSGSLAAGLIVGALLCLPRPGLAEALLPSPDLAPEAVVEAQLAALADNDTPDVDAGIELTWSLAHPSNRAATGPLERFAEMLHSPTYGALINHTRHTVRETERLSDAVAFEVQVVAADGALWRYQWVLEKVEGGELAGCWLSTAVLPLGRDPGQGT